MSERDGNGSHSETVWAGVASTDRAVDPSGAFDRLARARGGLAKAPRRMIAVAEFRDTDAAVAWIAELVSAQPHTLAASITVQPPDIETASAEAMLEEALADAGPGTLVLGPDAEIGSALQDWHALPGDSDSRFTHYRQTGDEVKPEAVETDETDDLPTQLAGATSGSSGSGGSAPDPRPAGYTPGPSGGRAPVSTAGSGEELRDGYVLSHTYEIERRIGRGGMGTVYLARHVELGSRHAVKVISPEHAQDEHIVGLFRKEAESLRSVRHDAVIAHEGTIRDENGRLYLVMEYADGPSLADVLRRGPLAETDAETLLRRIGPGLDAAHDKGIIHRDLSPDNIVLVDGDVSKAKVIDFGIARNLDAGSKTIIGSQFAGKFTYASPEQLGLFGGDVDGRSDIYSTGLILAAALGKPLDMGESPAEAARRREAAPDLSAFDEPWRSRLAAMLEPDPDDRLVRISDLPDIGSDARPRSDFPRSAPPASPTPSAGRRKRLWGLGGAVAALVLVVLGSLAATGILPVGGTADPAAENEAETATDKGDTSGSSKTQTADAAAEDGAAARTGRSELQAAVNRAIGAPSCARVTGRLESEGGGYKVALTGFVPSASELERIRGAVADLGQVAAVTSSVRLRPEPFCKLLETLPASGESSPRITLNRPDAIYREGQRLSLSVSPRGNEPRYVNVSYMDSSGLVLHMRPNPTVPSNRVEAGETLTVGRASGNGEHVTYTAAPPFGDNLLIVVASPSPIFSEPRPQFETRAEYERALGEALDKLRDDKTAFAVNTRLVRTVASD